jgi:hypothetical protein
MSNITLEQRLTQVTNDINNYFDNEMFDEYQIKASFEIKDDLLPDEASFSITVNDDISIFSLILSKSDQEIKIELANRILVKLNELQSGQFPTINKVYNG